MPFWNSLHFLDKSQRASADAVEDIEGGEEAFPFHDLPPEPILVAYDLIKCD